jgi:acyl transferase domain-containing protein
MRVPTENTPLPCAASSGKSLVAICGSGIGGANGHIIIESPPLSIMSDSRTSIIREDQEIRKPSLLVAGGLSPRTAATVAEHMNALAFANPSGIKLLSTIYGRRSKQMTWRSFSIYSPTPTSSEHDPTVTQNKLNFSVPTFVPRIQPPLVFVFCGQGPQRFHMGRELYGTYLVFRESILEMDNVYRCATGISLLESTGLFREDSPCPISMGDIWPIDITLPALAMLQCALVDLLASVGLKPDIAVAHSAGEAVVMYASGMASKAMVVDLAIARGRAMSLVENYGGTMAAVSCSILDAQNIISEALGPELADTVDIACHNSQDAVTLAGLTSSIDKIVAYAESRGFMARKLRTCVPVHSRMMELCTNEFRSAVEQVWSRYPAPHWPMIPVYSSVTGTLLVHSFSRDYFWDGTRGPVLFADTVTDLLMAHPASTFMEISPHPVLSSYLSSLGAKNIVASLRRPKRNETKHAELVPFLQALGQLSCLGHNSVDFSALNDDPVLDPNISLPPYPFNSKAVSYHAESISFHRRFQERNGPLNYPGLRVNSQTHPVLAQHVIKGEPIMPAAGFIEMVLLSDFPFFSRSTDHSGTIGSRIWRHGAVGCRVLRHVVALSRAANSC